MDLFSEYSEVVNQIKPIRAFSSIELFAGAGGLALGLEQAGFYAVLLNERDKYASATLRYNRPNWNLVESDVCDVDCKCDCCNYRNYHNEKY